MDSLTGTVFGKGKIESNERLCFKNVAFLAFVAQDDVRPIVEEQPKARDECTPRLLNYKDAYSHNEPSNIG